MPSSQKMTDGYINFLLARPKTVLVLFLLTIAALGSQAPRFTIDATPDTLLTRDNKLYTQSREINQRFSPREFLLITYEPHTHDVVSEKTFAVLARITEKLMRLDRVESVRSILNVPVFSQIEYGDLKTADLELTDLTIEGGIRDLALLREEFTDHPIYTNLLVNEDLSAAALQVMFHGHDRQEKLNARITRLHQRYHAGDLTEQEEEELRRLEAEAAPIERELNRIREREIETIREFLQEYETDADIHMGGAHVLGYQLIQIITNDLAVFGGVIGAGICLMLLLLFRGFEWVLIPVLCCMFSVLGTIGLFGMLGIKATVISANFIALQLILTLALVIHLIVQFREESEADAEASQRDLIRGAMRRKTGPVFYAGLTTSVGFGSLIFSGIQPVIAFGWMMIIAMVFSIFVSLMLFPVLLALISRRRQRLNNRIAPKTASALAYIAIRQRWPVLAVSMMVVAGSVSGLFRLNVENSFINYFKQSTQVYQELSYIDNEFGGSTPLDMIYTSPWRPDNPDIIMTAETVQMLQLIDHTLEKYEATGRILSPVNLTNLASDINKAPLTEYELTAAYWLLDETFREELIGSFFKPDTNEIRFNIWIQDLTPGLDRAQLIEDIHADMEQIGVSASNYMLTNLFILYQDILERLFDSQVRTLGLVYAAMTLMFLVIFRSMGVALIAITPNILSTMAILGVIGWAGIPLDLMTITITAIAMGIAADDTIHYVHRYMEERSENHHDQAVTRTHSSVGIAILYTTLLIVAGFSLLAFSDFVPSIVFGLLTALAMAIALIMDLCLLPVLMRWLPRKSVGAA
jgi:uncharacterized protein